MKARHYYYGYSRSKKRRRRRSIGRIIGGTMFFLVSHLLIIYGLVSGMTAQDMVRWLGISFGLIFILAAFIDGI